MEIQKKFNDLIKNNLKRLRDENNLTQKEMAEKIGLSVTQYQRIETQEDIVPSLRILYKIAEIFSVHISYFFTDTDISIINEKGEISVNKLSTNGVIALRSFEKFPPEERRDVQVFIKFKKYQMDQEKKDRQ